MKVKKLSEVKQPTRKKLWWVAVLAPLCYVIVDGWIYPIDERALLERTVYEEVQPEAAEIEETRESPLLDESEDVYSESGNGNGWVIFDKVFLRVKRAWPLLLSFLAIKYGRRFVGDPR